MTRTTLFSLIAALGLVAAPAVAQQAGEPPAGPPGGMAVDTAEFTALGLSADQRTKITAILDQLHQQNAPLREQMHQLTGGKSYRDLSAGQRDSLRPKLQPIRQQMMENARKAHEQMQAILTPEQRQKFAQHMHERRDMEGGPPHN